MTVLARHREKRVIGKITVLATPAFVISLAVLIVNDWYLKTQYPSWVTGKISDFSGLIVFSLILFLLIQSHVRVLGVLVSVLFMWWKSPYSQGFIDDVNAMGALQLGRTIDYTDFVALVVVPWSVRFFEAHERSRLPVWRWRSAIALPIGLIALLAVAGTSLVPYTRQFLIQETDEKVVLSDEVVEDVLASVAESDEFECSAPDGRPSSAEKICEIDSIWFTYIIEDGRVHFRVVDALPMFGSGRRTMRNVDELIEEIKVAFSREFNNLEYIEPLVERTPR